MTQYYIHIGAPKTGTTSIQKLLSINTKKLHEYDVYPILPWQLRKTPFMSYYMNKHTNGKTFNNYSYQEAKDSINNVIKNIAQNKILISEESFIHDTIPQKSWDGTFGGINNAAQTLSDFFGENCKIIIYLRRQDTFIQSCYIHRIKFWGQSLSFNEYLENHVDIFNLSWTKLIAPFVRVFGFENIIVQCFEDFKLGTKFTFDEFLKPVVDGNIFTNLNYKLDNTAINSSYSKVALDLALKCNSNLPPEKLDKFRKFLLENFSVKEYGKPKLLEDKLQNKIIEYYEKDNIDLFGKFISHRDYYSTWGKSQLLKKVK